MPRVRLTSAQMESEAARLADELVAELGYAEFFTLFIVHPDTFAPRSRSSKHPVVWNAMFRPILPPGAVMDGGELFVDINLETMTATLRE